MGHISKKQQLKLYGLTFVSLCLLTGYLYTMPVTSGTGFLYQRIYSIAFLVLMIVGLFVFIQLIGNEERFTLKFFLKVLIGMLIALCLLSFSVLSDLSHGLVSETYALSDISLETESVSQEVIRYDLVVSGESYRLTADHHFYLANTGLRGDRLKIEYYPKTKVVCDVEIIK